MNLNEITSLAYFGGFTIEQLAEKNLGEKNLRKIAGKCAQWAYETATPSIRSEYLERAEAIAALAEAQMVNELSQQIGLPVAG